MLMLIETKLLIFFLSAFGLEYYWKSEISNKQGDLTLFLRWKSSARKSGGKSQSKNEWKLLETVISSKGAVTKY